MDVETLFFTRRVCCFIFIPPASASHDKRAFRLATMSMPTVHTDLLGPNPVVLIDSRIPRIFNVISDEDQRGLVSQLEDFIEEVKADGSVPHLLRLGVLTPQNMDEKHFKKDHLLEKCYWQLAQLYRVSRESYL